MRISLITQKQIFFSLFFLAVQLGFAQNQTEQAVPPALGDAIPTTPPVQVNPDGGPAPASTPRIFVPIGLPGFKKVSLGIEKTTGNAVLAKVFHQTLVSDMLYTDLFDIIEENKMPPANANFQAGTFSWNPYRATGMRYLIKSSIESKGGTVEAEVRLYDVNKGEQIAGKRYPFKSRIDDAPRELANFSGNELMEALTGEAGIFRTRMLMSCGGRKKEIYIMDFDGDNVRQITRDGNFALSPSWAPDGNRIVFTSYKPAVKGGFVNPNLYTYNVSTNKRELITAAKGVNSGAVFHPFKNQLAYTYSNNGKPEIFMLDLEAKTRIALTQTMFFSIEPAWSPDGTKLAYSSSKTGKPHIYVSASDGSNAKQLTNAGVFNSSPRWSPKGDKIVFSGQENFKNNFNIFMIDPSGTNLVRLTDGATSTENPAFSPDGRHIAFSSNQGGSYQIYVMALHSGRVSRALTPKSLGDCKQPAWSPRM
jgi:TolB protein